MLLLTVDNKDFLPGHQTQGISCAGSHEEPLFTTNLSPGISFRDPDLGELLYREIRREFEKAEREDRDGLYTTRRDFLARIVASIEFTHPNWLSRHRSLSPIGAVG